MLNCVALCRQPSWCCATDSYLLFGNALSLLINKSANVCNCSLSYSFITRFAFYFNNFLN